MRYVKLGARVGNITYTPESQRLLNHGVSTISNFGVIQHRTVGKVSKSTRNPLTVGILSYVGSMHSRKVTGLDLFVLLLQLAVTLSHSIHIHTHRGPDVAE